MEISIDHRISHSRLKKRWSEGPSQDTDAQAKKRSATKQFSVCYHVIKLIGPLQYQKIYAAMVVRFILPYGI